MFFLTTDQINPLIQRLSINLSIDDASGDFNGDDLNITSGKYGILGIAGIAELLLDNKTIVNWVLDMVFPIGFPINLGSLLDLEELLGAPLTDINGILKKFLPDLALPTIDMNTIATLGQLVTRNGSARTFVNPALQLGAGQFWAVQADIADVFYYLIEFVLNFASGGGLAALGLDLSGIKVDMIGLDVEKVLTHMSPEDVIAALVELFNPNTTNSSPNGGDTAYAGLYTDGSSPYALNNWNWWYPTEDSVFFQSVEDISTVDFVYLNHENNWTLDKAEFFYNNSIGLVDAILGLLLTDETSKEYQDFYVVGEGSAANYLRNMIEKMFSSDGAWNVVELMAYTIGSLMGSLPEAILSLLENNFGININSWFETYGYMFYGEYFAEDGYFQPFDAANGLPEGTTHLTRVDNEIIPQYECLYCSDTDVKDKNDVVVVPGIRDEEGELKAGKKPLSGNFLEHYPQYVNSFAYPADPSTLRQYTCSNCGHRLVITYFATEIEVEEIPDNESVDKFTLQFGFVVLAYALSFGFMFLLGKLSNFTNSIAWGFNFLWASLAAMLIKFVVKKLRKDKVMNRGYINNYQMDRISGVAFDLMIVAGVSAIEINDIKNYIIPIIILSVVGSVITYGYIRKVSKECFKGFEHEFFLMSFGTLTGTASNGMILTKEIDPELRTPTSSLYILSNFPAMVMIAPLLFLLNFAGSSLTNAIIACCIFFVLWVLYSIYLFRRRIFKKHYKDKPVVVWTDEK
jgi:hypothetical protein